MSRTWRRFYEPRNLSKDELVSIVQILKLLKHYTPLEAERECIFPFSASKRRQPWQATLSCLTRQGLGLPQASRWASASWNDMLKGAHVEHADAQDFVAHLLTHAAEMGQVVSVQDVSRILGGYPRMNSQIQTPTPAIPLPLTKLVTTPPAPEDLYVPHLGTSLILDKETAMKWLEKLKRFQEEQLPVDEQVDQVIESFGLSANDCKELRNKNSDYLLQMNPGARLRFQELGDRKILTQEEMEVFEPAVSHQWYTTFLSQYPKLQELWKRKCFPESESKAPSHVEVCLNAPEAFLGGGFPNITHIGGPHKLSIFVSRVSAKVPQMLMLFGERHHDARKACQNTLYARSSFHIAQYLTLLFRQSPTNVFWDFFLEKSLTEFPTTYVPISSHEDPDSLWTLYDTFGACVGNENPCLNIRSHWVNIRESLTSSLPKFLRGILAQFSAPSLNTFLQERTNIVEKTSNLTEESARIWLGKWESLQKEIKEIPPDVFPDIRKEIKKEYHKLDQEIKQFVNDSKHFQDQLKKFMSDLASYQETKNQARYLYDTYYGRDKDISAKIQDLYTLARMFHRHRTAPHFATNIVLYAGVFHTLFVERFLQSTGQFERKLNLDIGFEGDCLPAPPVKMLQDLVVCLENPFGSFLS
jgi:hypothetical protein